MGSLAKSAHTFVAARASGELSFFVSVRRGCVDQQGALRGLWPVAASYDATPV
jgi:hypothetical protein